MKVELFLNPLSLVLYLGNVQTEKWVKEEEINIFICVEVDLSGMGDEIERIIKIYYFSNSYNKLF